MPPTTPNLDRQGLEILGVEDCWNLLASTPIGRIAFIDAGAPIVLPVNFALDRRSIVVRTAPGTKLHAAQHGQAVGFEIDAWDRVARRGWSVVASGIADHVLDPAEIDRLETLGLHPWAEATDRREWIRIRIEDVSGRRITQPPDDTED